MDKEHENRWGILFGEVKQAAHTEEGFNSRVNAMLAGEETFTCLLIIIISTIADATREDDVELNKIIDIADLLMDIHHYKTMTIIHNLFFYDLIKDLEKGDKIYFKIQRQETVEFAKNKTLEKIGQEILTKFISQIFKVVESRGWNVQGTQQVH
jgi:hypothetical protein